MNQTNYQKELEKLIDGMGDLPHSLLLHACCAPCSSYCMEYLRNYFDITVFYYNPNISTEAEYDKRVQEEIRLINAYNTQIERFEKAKENNPGITEIECEAGIKVTDKTRRIRVITADYDPNEFYDIAKGYEKCPEGGDRCSRCFELRLRKSFDMADQMGIEYVTTTLTISPLKNADKLNRIGYDLSDNYEATWLPSDFKKKGGYQRSIVLSGEYDLYRQNFCGCAFSKPAN